MSAGIEALVHGVLGPLFAESGLGAVITGLMLFVVGWLIFRLIVSLGGDS